MTGHFLTQRLNQHQILTGLTGIIDALQVHVWPVIDSTHDHIIRQTLASQCQIHVAEKQTAGHGQRGQIWDSPAYENLYVSMRWQLPRASKDCLGVSQVASLALAQALSKQTKLASPRLGIKWPNDLYVDGKKIAGLLLHIKPGANHGSDVTVSFGLNVNQLDLFNDRTSLYQVTGQQWDRNSLLISLIALLYQMLEQFSRLGFAPFIDTYHQYDELHNATVTLTVGNQTIQGQYLGLSPDGGLQLWQDGQIMVYYTGAVAHVRKQSH